MLPAPAEEQDNVGLLRQVPREGIEHYRLATGCLHAVIHARVFLLGTLADGIAVPNAGQSRRYRPRLRTYTDRGCVRGARAVDRGNRSEPRRPHVNLPGCSQRDLTSDQEPPQRPAPPDSCGSPVLPWSSAVSRMMTRRPVSAGPMGCRFESSAPSGGPTGLKSLGSDRGSGVRPGFHGDGWWCHLCAVPGVQNAVA